MNLTFLVKYPKGVGCTPKRMLEPGERAPDFELKGTTGEGLALSNMLENGPVMLFLFKVSCPVCQMTGPFLERLASGNGMRVVGISQDDHEATVAFMRRFGLTFPVLLDSVRTGYVVSNGFGISSVPSTFVVERDQKLSTAYAGFSKADLELLGARMGVQPFRAEERVPAFRAG